MAYFLIIFCKPTFAGLLYISHGSHVAFLYSIREGVKSLYTTSHTQTTSTTLHWTINEFLFNRSVDHSWLVNTEQQKIINGKAGFKTTVQLDPPSSSSGTVTVQR
jgi:hypothetical protein